MRGDEFFQRISNRPPFTKLHPRVAAFFLDYFSREKVLAFGDRFVINTNFPPYPSPAFEHLVGHFALLGNAATRRLYSVTVAVTNRCRFNCWHCYNAGRSQNDLPLATLQALARELQDLGAVMVTLTGGEPLLRRDLPEIVRAFDRRSCLVLGTTGDGLTPECAQQLRADGLFAVGISLDSDQEAEHDRLRGRPGAFQAALAGLQAAREAGLYAYVVAVATRELLPRSRFFPFLQFAAKAGALEVHLLEPNASGKLAGQPRVLLSAAERRQIFHYQAEVAGRDDLPQLSCFAWLEAPEAFGCGAGLTHLYVDGSGEVCPCNLVPLSFGNVADEPLARILERMGSHFQQPRTGCLGRMLGKHFPRNGGPLPQEQSCLLCEQHVPVEHDLPAFFRIRNEVRDEAVGAGELREAYDRVHQDYDAFWLVAAAEPTERLIERIPWNGREQVFEAGCGTGYATARLARRSARVTAVDLSAGMQSQARARLAAEGRGNVRWVTGDALAAMESAESSEAFDCVFSSWVLGYIPLAPFFQAARRALKPGGRLAFIVHRENSPRRELELFSGLVAEDPAVLRKRVAFDFPRDTSHVQSLLEASGFEAKELWQDAIVFRYETAQQVLEHLLKSGAGTAFYDAVDPDRREALTARFLERLSASGVSGRDFEVRHEYVGCLAVVRDRAPEHAVVN